MKTPFRLLAVLVALLMAGQVGRAAEAARMQNYDRWKDLPTMRLVNIGHDFYRVGKTDSALLCFFIISNRYDDGMTVAEKGLCCGATLTVGDLYMHDYYDYHNAYRYLLKAERIASYGHLTHQMADIYATMAVLQADRKEQENNYSYQPTVLALFKTAFHQAVQIDDHVTACISLSNLSYYAIKHDHVVDIIEELDAFYKLKISDSIKIKTYSQRLCEGVMAFQESKYQKAYDIFLQLEDLLPQRESPQAIARDRSMTCVFRYVTLCALNNNEEALQELDKAESIARENNLDDAIVEYLRMKQDYYETHGNTALAKEYKLKYFEAKDEFINRSKLLSVEQQKFLVELEEMGEEVKDLEAQKRMRELVIAGIAVLALLVIAALIFLWRNYQNTKHRNLLLFQKNQELLALEQERDTQGEKYKSSPMDEQAKDELLRRIHHVMENHDEIYDEGFTLDQMAGLIDANPNYVSQVINEKKGCNFKAFINDYKIKEACRRLSDPDNYGTYTVEAIGQSVGFGSRTHFYAIFKKFTGMTPAAYQRLAQDKPSDSQ